MSQKPFDHIENKIKEASESFEPGFDQESWNKMEVLLDARSKKDRKPFAWLWFVLPLLLLGGAGVYFSTNRNTTKEQTPQYEISKQSIDHNTITAIAKTDNIDKEVDNKNVQNKKKLTNNSSASKTKTNFIDKKKLAFNTVAATIGNAVMDNDDDKKIEVEADDKNVSTDSEEKILATNDKKIITKDDNIKNTAVAEEDKKEKNIATEPVGEAAKKKINKENKASRFYLTGSIGADIAGVQFLSFNNSKATAKYGLGIGYQLTKKISVQTGFYAGHKKYIAGPYDYTAKPGTYLSTVDMEKINADCLIYEIPLSIRYNIFSAAKTTYYATTGLSSFIMKNEDYYYYYKRDNTPYESAWEYTGNKNLFSVFTLSAGVERRLTNRLFIQVEPSVSIPVSGVGEGKVKLYSTTLQLGLKYELPHK